jgi:cytochrome c-type biogenesis protein CcmE
MSPRQKRMALVFGIIAGVSVAGALALNAFRQNVTFFFDPTQVASGEVTSGERFRLGGMVTKGSVQRAPGSLEVHFVVTDFKHDVPVSYTGVLPDLFREGQGVVAHGRMTGNTFVADEVLAKHDEKYMPPEVARSLKKRQEEGAMPGGQPPTRATQVPPSGVLNTSPGALTTLPGALTTLPGALTTLPGALTTHFAGPTASSAGPTTGSAGPTVTAGALSANSAASIAVAGGPSRSPAATTPTPGGA